MQYMGGKQRIAKPLCEFLNTKLKSGGTFVDLFCGSANVVSNIRNDVTRIASDVNPLLPALWSAMQKGWEPPSEISVDDYVHWRNKDPLDEIEQAMKAFVGFGCSFSGKWFGGFARSSKRNYAENARNSCIKKAKMLTDVVFMSGSYSEIDIPPGAVVYCDIPYFGTTSYSATGDFDHDAFYRWLIEKSETHDIYVSEYERNVPDWCAVVWRHESKKDMRDKEGNRVETVEVLYKVA